MKKFDYLNLELYNHNLTTCNTEEHKHICYFGKTFNHQLHGKNSQLNILVDIILKLTETIVSLYNRTNKNLELIIQTLHEKIITSRNIVDQIIYLKQILEDFNKAFKPSEIATKSELRKLIVQNSSLLSSLENFINLHKANSDSQEITLAELVKELKAIKELQLM